MQKVVVAIACGVLMCGCSSIKSTLGFKKTTPDEFTVISYPHLSVPPNFDLAEPSVLENIGTQQGVPNFQQASYSNEEKMLIDKITGDIKIQSQKEYKDKAKSSNIGLFGKKGDIVEPEEEKVRIDENKKVGKAINDVGVRPEKSTLERILGS